MRRICTLSVIALLLLAGCSGFERVLEEIFPSEPYTVMEGSITDYFEDGIRAIGKQGDDYVIETERESIAFKGPSSVLSYGRILIEFSVSGDVLTFSSAGKQDLVIRLNCDAEPRLHGLHAKAADQLYALKGMFQTQIIAGCELRIIEIHDIIRNNAFPFIECTVNISDL